MLVLHSAVKTLELTENGAVLLDQTLLPGEVKYATIQTARDMADAIRTMIVRGAPAIGIAGAFGVVLSLREQVEQASKQTSKKIMAPEKFRQQVLQDIDMLNATRPTAVNLAWALNTMQTLFEECLDQKYAPEEILDILTKKAHAMHKADIEANQRMGEYGAEVILTEIAAGKPSGNNIKILTHCNAGALATAGYGTALGVVRSVFSRDKTLEVFADETRPRLQGAKLTTWELAQDGIPVTLITDGMSGSLMRRGDITCVIVGADRIAANGDTANKIGTYNLALVAHAHGVPFYVAAPLSTIDRELATGDEIPIETRDDSEISQVGDSIITPSSGVRYYNPAFDVTPAKYISAIITEAGVARADYTQSIRQLFRN